MKKHLRRFFFLNLVVGGALAALPPAPPPGQSIERTVDFERKPADRVSWDFPFKQDLRYREGVAFDFYCEYLSVFSSLHFYFKSGKGWYHTSFAPSREGAWEHITIDKNETTTEGEPAGWTHIEAVRLAAERNRDAITTLGFANLVPTGNGQPMALVLRAESQLAKAGGEALGLSLYAASIAHTLNEAQLPTRLMADTDWDDSLPASVRLIVLPYNPGLPAGLADRLHAFVSRGGKLMAFYSLPTETAALLELQCLRNQPAGKGTCYRGFARTAQALDVPGQPAFVPQASWSTTLAEPLRTGRVLAVWRGPDGNDLGDCPAITLTPAGAFFGHVWFGGARRPQLELMHAVVGELLPEIRGPEPRRWSAAYSKRLDAIEGANQAWLAAQKPRAPEERAFWCHSAWGLGDGRTWDESIRLLKTNGFNTILVNFAWGGVAFYPSRVLPVSPLVAERGDPLLACLTACRKYGIKLHVWKVCWYLGSHTAPEFGKQMAAAKRTQRRYDGQEQTQWLCPSHPENQALEIAAMKELAGFRIDGIHFDYIRYPGADACFCDGCRERFERSLGWKSKHWPQDVRENLIVAQAWERFRCDNISQVVRSVAEFVHAQKRKVEISAAVFPNAQNSHRTIGQAWDRWCQAGWLDAVRPMDYVDSPAVFKGIITQQKRQTGHARLLPGMGLSCWKNPRDPINLAQQILAVRELNLPGYTIFNFDNGALEVLPALHQGITRDDKLKIKK